ncbi:MAG: hypothetical protein ACK5FE_12105 [Cyanobacteriota bacterium]|jgi:hypothetical protein
MRPPRLAALLLSLPLGLLVSGSSPALAEVLNLEFGFTAFRGDPATADRVPTVAGKAELEINGLPLLEKELEADQAMVLFAERRLSPGLWLPMESFRRLLRRQGNSLVLRFTPRQVGAPYSAQLSWNSVEDSVSQRRQVEGNRVRLEATNETDRGSERRDSRGPVEFRRSFDAPFADEQPWQSQPPIQTIQPADRSAILALVRARRDLYAADMTAAYRLLEGFPGLDAAVLRQQGCLEQAWRQGVRVKPLQGESLQLLPTGGPVVVVRPGRGELFPLQVPPGMVDRLSLEQTLCVSGALVGLLPPWMGFVQDGQGGWRPIF